MYLDSDVATQSAVFRRVVSKYWRTESHQLQHSVRLQDPDDDLPRHRPCRRHAVAVGDLQLDPPSLRRVSQSFASNNYRLSFQYIRQAVDCSESCTETIGILSLMSNILSAAAQAYA